MTTATIHIDVPKNLLLKANGGQGQVYANAQRAKHLRHKGATIGCDWINQHQPWTPYRFVDVEYEIHYPKRQARADPDNLAPTVKHLVDGLTDAGLWADDDYQHRADPDNLAPTVKHLVDGLTDAGLWADDDYQHLRRRTYTMGPPTRTTGLWRVSIHITPITR